MKKNKYGFVCVNCNNSFNINENMIRESKALRCPSCGSMDRSKWKRSKK